MNNYSNADIDELCSLYGKGCNILFLDVYFDYIENIKLNFISNLLKFQFILFDLLRFFVHLVTT